MGLYYLDIGTNERVHLKTYNVGLGKKNPQLPSGSLTPLGTYSLGNKIAVYKPGVNGQYMNKSTEMVRVFGTDGSRLSKRLTVARLRQKDTVFKESRSSKTARSSS